MHFSFVTLFPSLMEGYFSQSILKRGLERGAFSYTFVNPRDYTTDKFLRVDAPMVGGGAGMLMTPQPLYDAIDAICKRDPLAHVVFLSPVGKPFRQTDAKRFAALDHLVLVSGRYEGIDERVIEEWADEVISIGDFVLTGGELASLVVCDATVRHLDGVLGNEASLQEESFETPMLEAPAFTKPHLYKGKHCISEYLKGNHSKISDLKMELARCKTQFHRPDLYQKVKQ